MLDDVARAAQQDFPLAQRVPHQAEGVVLEIAKPAVDHLARRRGRAAGEVVLLGQQDREAAPGGIARHHRAVDAATDDEDIVNLVLHVALAGIAAATSLLHSAGP